MVWQDMSEDTGISKHGEPGTNPTTWCMQQKQTPPQQKSCAITKPCQSGLPSIGFGNKDSTSYNHRELMPKTNKSKLENLQKQRAYLLGTGVYNVGDRVIQGLDQEIQMLMTGTAAS